MSLGRILFLAFLALAVTQGPKALAKLAPGSSNAGQFSQLAALSRQAQSTSVTLTETGGIQAIPPDLQRMLDQAAADPQSFTDEERQLLSSLKDMGQSSAMSAPVLESLRQTQQRHTDKALNWTGSIRGAWTDFLSSCSRHRSRCRFWLWSVPGLLSALALLGIFLGAGLTRLFAGLCYNLARVWLWILAWGAAGLAGAVQVNAWLALPGEFVSPPALALLLSTILLKMIDANYPAWNSVVQGFLAPIGSGLFCLLVQLARSAL
ncbi:MAG TPA: hypothetical protein DCM05_01230 [Elusimicrobia bacterium]|nr:hypothetical protein [Elusimicrobiota bacterium]